jgi:hypothetical protein
MTAQNLRPEGARQPRDAAHWAHYVEALKAPEGAVGLNVEGRRVVGPLQGFGKMWQKTYRARLTGASASPAEVVGVWRQRFPELSGFGKGFRVPSGGLVPGAVALLGGLSGVMVLYSDEESFTYMTPEGHPFSGWITFSAYEEEDGTTVAQAHLLIRANDPLYELVMPLGLHKVEDRKNLAAHAPEPGSILRRERRSRDPRGLRGREAAVATVREHPAQRHRALGSPRGNRAAAPIAPPIRGSSPQEATKRGDEL